MARAMTLGEADAPKVQRWVPQGAEDEKAMQENRETLDSLEQKLKILGSIKERMSGLTGAEIRLTEGLSREGYRVYRDLTAKLKARKGRPARAARMSAILMARHADIVADAMRRQGVKGDNGDYTALDYYAKTRLGEAANGEEGYKQAITNPDIDLDEEVKVLDLDSMDNGLSGKTDAEVIQYIKSISHMDPVPVKDFKTLVGIPHNDDYYGQKHLVKARSKKIRKNIRARNIVLKNLKDVLKETVLVEVSPNIKVREGDTATKSNKAVQKRKRKVNAWKYE